MTGVQLRLLLMTAKTVRRIVGALAEEHIFNHVQLSVITEKLDEAIYDVEQEEKNNPDRR